MKDYEITRIWAEEIADICKLIDRNIDNYNEWLNEDQEKIPDWKKDDVKQYQERIKALQWMLNIINAPFKINKK